jgi:isoleucyl-tRNA synthetase
MEIKDSILLPKTEFSMKANLPEKEPKILDKWYKDNLYGELRSQSKDKEKFILHDGPPYANGHLHMGHALNKILKDVIILGGIVMGCLLNGKLKNNIGLKN